MVPRGYSIANDAYIHRSLGVQHSFVLSVTLDQWTPDQVHLMDINGNRKVNVGPWGVQLHHIFYSVVMNDLSRSKVVNDTELLNGTGTQYQSNYYDL